MGHLVDRAQLQLILVAAVEPHPQLEKLGILHAPEGEGRGGHPQVPVGVGAELVTEDPQGGGRVLESPTAVGVLAGQPVGGDPSAVGLGGGALVLRAGQDGELPVGPGDPDALHLPLGRHGAGDQGAAGHGDQVAGQGGRHHEEGGQVEGRVPPHRPLLQPPAPTAQDRARLVDGQGRVEEGQVQHALAQAKETVRLGQVLVPVGDGQVPAQVNAGLLAGEESHGQVDAHRAALGQVGEGGRLPVHGHAAQGQLPAVLLQGWVEAEDHVGPGIRAGVGDPDGAHAPQLGQLLVQADGQLVAGDGAQFVQLGLGVGLHGWAVAGVGIGGRSGLHHAGRGQQSHPQGQAPEEGQPDGSKQSRVRMGGPGARRRHGMDRGGRCSCALGRSPGQRLYGRLSASSIARMPELGQRGARSVRGFARRRLQAVRNVQGCSGGFSRPSAWEMSVV